MAELSALFNVDLRKYFLDFQMIHDLHFRDWNENTTIRKFVDTLSVYRYNFSTPILNVLLHPFLHEMTYGQTILKVWTLKFLVIPAL